MGSVLFARIFVLVAFLANDVGLCPIVYAQEFRLPGPGAMVHLSPEFNPPILKGIKVHPDNPFLFDFILDKGDSELSNDQLKDESTKLIKYFLASLTIPEKDLWVNLSPYEKDRIIPQSFGLTVMGRDLLGEDYMLKQITASLIYPEDEIGKRFWKRIYEEAEKRFGTTNIPVNTFNKVWIVPEKAVVYENAKAGTAYVEKSELKVMLEQDYLSLAKHEAIQSEQVRVKDNNQLGSQIIREVVIPELTKEVNEDKNFAQLRQAYQSLILATWYKRKIKDSILSQVYTGRNKTAGVNIDNPQEKQKIYQRYLQAFKKGVYNYIKEEPDPTTNEMIPRKYFSGGITDLATNIEIKEANDSAMLGFFEPLIKKLRIITTRLNILKNNDDIVLPIETSGQTTPLRGDIDESRNVRIEGDGLEALKHLHDIFLHRDTISPLVRPVVLIDEQGRKYEMKAEYSLGVDGLTGSLNLFFEKYQPVVEIVYHFVNTTIPDAYIEEAQLEASGLSGKGFYKTILREALAGIPVVRSNINNSEMRNTILKRYGSYRVAHSVLWNTVLGHSRPDGYILTTGKGSFFTFQYSLFGKQGENIKQLFEEAVKVEVAWNPTPGIFKIKKEERNSARIAYPNQSTIFALKKRLIMAGKAVVSIGKTLYDNEVMLTAIDRQIERLDQLAELADTNKSAKSFQINNEAIKEENGKETILEEWNRSYPSDMMTREILGGGIREDLWQKVLVQGASVRIEPSAFEKIMRSKNGDSSFERFYLEGLRRYRWTIANLTESYKSDVGTFTIPDDLMDILSSIHNDMFKEDIHWEHIEGFQDSEFIFVRESVYDRAKAGRVNDIMTIRHEQRHADIHMSDEPLIENGIINELYAEFFSFFDLYGPAAFNRRFRDYQNFGAYVADRLQNYVAKLKNSDSKIIFVNKLSEWTSAMQRHLSVNPNETQMFIDYFKQHIHEYRDLYPVLFGDIKEAGISDDTKEYLQEKYQQYQQFRRDWFVSRGLTVVDDAMIGHSKSENLGGIDLTPANLDLQTQNNGGEIQFHLDSAMLQQLQNAPGFIPVIINIQPITDLRILLGITSS